MVQFLSIFRDMLHGKVPRCRNQESSMDFRWNDWNEEHITNHGVSVAEAESVARSGKPQYRPDGKYLAVGRGQGDRWLQVIYILDEDGTVFVIHARPLTDREKRRWRRRQK